MRVKFRVTIESTWPSVETNEKGAPRVVTRTLKAQEGSEHEVDDKHGTHLIELGYAEEVR